MVKHKLDIPLSLDDQEGRVKEVMFCKSILSASRKGDIQVYTSTITQTEFLHAGKDNNLDDKAKRLIDAMLTSGKGGVILVQCSQFVTTRARDLYREDEIKIGNMDRIHLASALDAECDEFITVDNDDFIKKAEKIDNLGIKVIYPSQTKLLPEKYRQMDLEIEDEEDSKEEETERESK